MTEIINSANDLNKIDKLKVLFLRLNILQKIVENDINNFQMKEKRVKTGINIIFVLNLLILLCFQNIYTVIFCLIILCINIYASFFPKTITLSLIKDKKNDLLFSLEKDKFLKISIDDEFLLKTSLEEYIKSFNLQELIELDKDDFFKNEKVQDLKSLFKNERIDIPEIEDILNSKDYVEYILSGKSDNESYNFVYNIYNVEKQKLKDYIRIHYNSEFVLNNKEKIKEILNKEKDYFYYEIILLNKY